MKKVLSLFVMMLSLGVVGLAADKPVAKTLAPPDADKVAIYQLNAVKDDAAKRSAKAEADFYKAQIDSEHAMQEFTQKLEAIKAKNHCDVITQALECVSHVESKKQSEAITSAHK